MALALDSSSGSYFGTASSSHTLSHTCSGSRRVLVVWVHTYDSGTATGVTYNGVSMTEVGTAQAIGSDNLQAFRLIAPATGANNIVASLSASKRATIFGISLTGADQTTQPDSNNKASATSASATSTITTVADNAWGVMAYVPNGAGDASGSHTNWTQAQSIAGRGAMGYGGPKTPAGSFTQTIALSGSGQWGVIQVGIKPSTLVDYTITADLGTFTLTGIDAALKYARIMVAALGTFTLTGIAAGLNRGFTMVASVGTFTLTGIAASLLAARKITAAVGSFTLTGIAANFMKGYQLVASVGSFILTGIDIMIVAPIRWINRDKNSATYTNEDKNSSTYTNQSKSNS